MSPDADHPMHENETRTIGAEEARAAIAGYEPLLRALILDMSDEAVALQKAAETRGGALSGMTVTVKDIIDLQNTPTTNGARFPAHVADSDAEVVRRLRAAGAVFVGKTNLHEFAYGGTTLNPHFGECRNPWDTDRIAGGSSGGSAAAVAAGYCDLSLGSDTAGSGRMPAALTGICALRPSLGRISNSGVQACSPFFDTISPMARSVKTLARAYEILAGYDEGDPLNVMRDLEMPVLTADLSGRLIGVATGAFFNDETDAAILRRVEAAVAVLTDLGATCVPVEIPRIEDSPTHLETLFHCDAAMVHAQRLAEAPELFGADIRERLRSLGAAVRGTDYSASRLWTEAWRREIAPVLESVDAVVHAASPTVAPRIADCRATTAATRRLAKFCYPWSLAGVPSMSVPCGFADHDLPCGMMLVGRLWGEADLLSVGYAYQSATDWHQTCPSILERTK